MIERRQNASCSFLSDTTRNRDYLGRVVIATYTQQPALYAASQALLDLPYPKLALQSWSKTYLSDLLKIESDWIIHIDEDAFVFDCSCVQGLLDFMAANNYACCGMPDGGAVGIRKHNPVACNPFFCIIQRRLIRETMLRDPRIHSTAWNDDYRKHTASFVEDRGLKFAYDDFEPYYTTGSNFGSARMVSKFSTLTRNNGEASPKALPPY